MRHDAKLAHQNLQKVCVSRDVDVFTLFSYEAGGVRVY